MSGLTEEAGVVDARPATRVSSATIWREAVALRDQFYDRLNAFLSDQGVRALVTRSPNGSYPVWVRLEAWMPTSGGEGATDERIRAELQLTIDVKPFHEHPLVVSAAAFNGRKRIAISDRPSFGADDAADWAQFAIGLGDRPRNYTPIGDFFAALILGFIPFARGPHANRVRREFRNRPPVSAPQFMMVLGALSGGFGATLLEGNASDRAVGAPMLFVGLVLFLVALVLYSRRRQIVAVMERPDVPPRELIWVVDSWHGVVADLGKRFDEVRRRLEQRLGERRDDALWIEAETYGFRTPNGYEERERLVISKGQGVAHVHVYRFGDDVFVGWDSYLNWAKWGETTPVSVRGGAASAIEYRSLKEQLYIPNQFDLIDLNTLAEVVHRDVTDTLKTLMAEYKIDQEIDFQIIRGDRDRALDKERFDRSKNTQRQAERQSRSRLGAAGGWKLS